MVDWSPTPVPVGDLDKEVLKELMAENRGLTLLGLKKRSKYSSVTTTSAECYDEQETSVVSPPTRDASDHLCEISSSILPVDPEVLTLKHSAFLAHLLMKKVDLVLTLGDSTPRGSHDQAVPSIRARDGHKGQVPGAKPSPKNMPVSWYGVQDDQKVLWAKAEGIEQQTRVDLLKET